LLKSAFAEASYKPATADKSWAILGVVFWFDGLGDLGVKWMSNFGEEASRG